MRVLKAIIRMAAGIAAGIARIALAACALAAKVLAALVWRYL